MDRKTDWEALAQMVQEDRRKGRRIPLTFPIEVSGLDATGRLFVEQAMTSDISERGCRFKLTKRISPGDVVAIRLLARLSPSPHPNQPMLFEIAWVEEEAGEWITGAKMLEAREIWPVEFPHQPAPQKT